MWLKNSMAIPYVVRNIKPTGKTKKLASSSPDRTGCTYVMISLAMWLFMVPDPQEVGIEI